MAITSNVLLSSPANVYVSSGNSVISAAYFCNTSNTAATFNVYLIPSGSATANASVQIYNAIQLAGNDTYVMDWEKLVLGDGDMLRANTAGSITATISYVGI